MSPADRPDARHRVLGLAERPTAYPRKHEDAFEARAGLQITELRRALSDAGVDLRGIRADFLETAGQIGSRLQNH